MQIRKYSDKLKSKLFVKEYDIDDIDPDDFPEFFYPSDIIEIVLTGGPCSGKSDLVKVASDMLKEKNIPVFVVNETATELLKSNLVFDDDPVAFQMAVCSLQLAKEKTIKEYAQAYLKNKSLTNAVIIYDRSAWDGRAYIDDEEWIENVSDRYNVYNNLGNRFVIHLESAAQIGKFSKDNNEERYENDETAKKLDKRIFDIYRTHPCFVHIPAREDYEQKKKEFLKVFMEYIEKRLVKKEDK